MQPANLPDDGGLPRSVAIVGTGVIGRSWLRVFSRTGVPVRFWDASEEALERAAAWHDGEARRDRAPATLVRQCGSLDEALEHADYVQESGPENLALKQELYRDLDRLAPPDAILASSTSALDMTEIAAGLEGCNRCVVAHPVNPPHVVPVVEVLGGTRTDPSVVEATVRVLRAVGQSPVVLKRFVPGFLLNRMQAALVREALALLESGVADADAIDAVIRDGLGLRWALMGPFGVANTNADGGVREYFTRYGASFVRLMEDLGATPQFSKDLIDRIGASTDAMEQGAALGAIREWRDRLVRRLIELKQQDPHP